ncbi:putative glutathione-dependent formaldehyde-activating enzyme [Aspergillus heterothallicus]
MSKALPLHPLLDSGAGLKQGKDTFPGGTLSCRCASNKVTVKLTSNVAHNHACGCSKCWKPEGALFSIVGVVPRDALSISANQNKLSIIDESAPIRRYACKECGVHLFGRIEVDHPFKGLDFVHTELSDEEGWQAVQFAGFVSSLIGQGLDPSLMDKVREQLKGLGLQSYDALSPPLMDAIAAWNAKKDGVVFRSVI